ncbi:MAG: hypothetical protein EHM47_00545, partial [Ignavibacteriales bacterium]
HSLTKAQWDSVTAFVQKHVTDSVITNAVKKLPPEMFKKTGEQLISILKIRRDNLNEISEEFYLQVIKYVDIHLSNKDELAEIDRLNDKEVEVKVYDLDKNKIPKSELFYNRTFNSDETSEIRLIMYDGDDKAIINGNVDESIKLLVAGDKGKDTLIDSSLVKGYFLSFLPIPDAEEKTIFLDQGDKTVFVTGSSTTIWQEKYERDTNDIEIPRDWGHDWRFIPWFNFNPDDGLFVGGGAVLYEFGFRRRPYVYRMELTGGYAIHAKRFRLRYTAEYNPPIRDITFLLDVKTSGLEVLNFYGFGNETAYNDSLKEEDFYKVKQQQVYVHPSVKYFINRNSTISFGTQLKYTDTDDGEYLFQVNPFGADNSLLLSINADYLFDSRQSKDFPTSGYSFFLSGSIYPPLKKENSVFGKINSEARGYFSVPQIRLSALALRIGGEKIWGRFPFFESAFIGGESVLRGYDRNRFAGDASIYGNLELRFFLFQTKILVPAYFGITALGDAGRVFYSDEKSEKIRNSYGGGLWMSFVKPEYLFTLYYARSSEDSGFYFNIGFPF